MVKPLLFLIEIEGVCKFLALVAHISKSLTDEKEELAEKMLLVGVITNQVLSQRVVGDRSDYLIKRAIVVVTCTQLQPSPSRSQSY